MRRLLPALMAVVLCAAALCAKAANGLLWRVSGNGLERPTYILGSHHLAPASFIDSIAGLRDIIAGVDSVYGEVTGDDLSSAGTQQAMLAFAMAPADSTLSHVLTPGVYTMLDSIMAVYTGMPGVVKRLDVYKPAFIEAQLSLLQIVAAFPQLATGEMFDTSVMALAQGLGKPVGGFETVDLQLRLLLGAPVAKQAEKLTRTVLNNDELLRQAVDMTRAYLDQDLDEVTRIAFDPAYGMDVDDDLEAVVYRRNEAWCDRLTTLMPRASLLVVVGCGHLGSDRGLLNLLRQRGYTVEPVVSRDTPSALIEISNPSDTDTVDRMVEIDCADLPPTLRDAPFVIKADGKELPYQITYDGKLIFQVSVAACSTLALTASPGIPAPVAPVACGDVYPTRQDDLAWENDRVGFRAYGPATERRGERLYGYDLFLKRDTAAPVIPGWMALNNDPIICARIDSLRRAGQKQEARLLDDSKSYHIDHGHGMDCYAVGPTLGAATAALVVDGKVIYPWCYDSYEILDNGPLRFTVALTLKPQVIGADTVTERRLITLDAGSHLNHTRVSYQGLRRQARAVVGIVVHDSDPVATCDSSEGIIAYTDPTQGSDNGELYIGAVFPTPPVDTAIADLDGNRHVAAYIPLDDDSSLTYLWGFGWNRSDIPSRSAWIDYLRSAAQAVARPLQIAITPGE